MANKKLTDLNSITTLSNDDVLYIVDPLTNTSNKITYGNLINTKFNSLSTDFSTTTDSISTLVIGGATNATFKRSLSSKVTDLSGYFGQTFSNSRFVDQNNNQGLQGFLTNLFTNSTTGLDVLINTTIPGKAQAQGTASSNPGEVGPNDSFSLVGLSSRFVAVSSFVSNMFVDQIGLEAQADNLGLTASGGTEFPTPTEPPIGQINTFTSLQRGIRHVPIYIGGTTFRLLLSAEDV